jgi:3D (Asp-Asp-Asp) domain-containing protein
MSKCINKLVISATVLSMIIAIIAGYFILATNKANIALDTVRNNLSSTLDELYAVEDQLFSTQDNLKKEIYKSSKLEESLNEANKEIENINLKLEEANSALESANITIDELKSNEYKLVYIGDFKLTHYCCEKYEHICGTGSGITATGTKVTAGRTIAVDPKVIPYGTKVYIEGYGWRTAEDCGGAVKNKQIDIAVETHSKAWSMGTKSGGVWMLVKN